MDFFEQQERARKQSGRLVFLFALALLAMVTVIYLAVWVAMGSQAHGPVHTPLWDPGLFAFVALAVGVVVGAGSMWKTNQLKGGGEVVAWRMGGHRLDPGTRDWKERRLLNVVEEMAIASGTPVPAVFLLDDEEGINAFAAGHAPGDAVIGVTRGAMEKLSRDELQGVIGHEFSHILNGDMRLNLRLMGVLFGILLLGLIGRIILRGGGGRRRSRNSKGSGGIALVGLALFIVGYVGTFCGELIQAAVSRQREFLADASSVQFTRNPAGISGALQKIGGFVRGSRLHAAHAAEASHMFFGDGLKRLSGLMATHPPLEERIKRIDPTFQGRFPAVAADYVAPPEPELAGLAAEVGAVAVAGFAGGTAAAPPRTPRGPAAVPARPAPSAGSEPAADAAEASPGQGALERIGDPGAEHVAYARRLLASVPPPLMDAARDAVGSRALVLALLLGDGSGDAGAEAEALDGAEAGDVAAAAWRLAPLAASLPPEARLPLVEAAAGTLTALPRPDAERFVRALRTVASADGELALEEWLLVRLVMHHLQQHLDPTRALRAPDYRSLQPFTMECSVLLSALVRAGSDDAAEAERAFQAASAALALRGVTLRPAEEAGAPRLLEASLETLSGLVPELKRRLVRACATSVAADGVVTAREAELFRVVADGLGAPIPPLLPGQRLR